MRNYIKTRGLWWALNLSAAAIFLYVVRTGGYDFQDGAFDTGLESGKWAIRFLLLCLAMTPLYAYFGWRDALTLRKAAGLWAFAFASVHVAVLVREERLIPTITLSPPPYVLLGLFGLVVLTALALTSYRRAMQFLGRWWKRLHRLVYFAALAVAGHAVLAVNMSKKMMFMDPNASTELNAYFAVVVVLLVVRLPALRRMVKVVGARLYPQPKREVVITPIPILRAQPLSLPPVYTYGKVARGREGVVEEDEEEKERVR